MFLKLLLTDLPEMFYTINLIPGILIPSQKFWPLTLTLIFGVIFLLACLIVFFIFYFKKNLDSKKYYWALLGLMVAAWLPLYLNFTYNNIYDLSENLNLLKLNVSSRRILRACNMDNRQNQGGVYCRLFSFFTFTKNNLAKGTNVRLLASPGLDGFFNYFLYPNYKITDKADYVLFYFSPNHFYENGVLYEMAGNKNINLGKYALISAKSDWEFILKKQ